MRKTLVMALMFTGALALSGEDGTDTTARTDALEAVMPAEVVTARDAAVEATLSYEEAVVAWAAQARSDFQAELQEATARNAELVAEVGRLQTMLSQALAERDAAEVEAKRLRDGMSAILNPQTQ